MNSFGMSVPSEEEIAFNLFTKFQPPDGYNFVTTMIAFFKIWRFKTLYSHTVNVTLRSWWKSLKIKDNHVGQKLPRLRWCFLFRLPRTKTVFSIKEICVCIDYDHGHEDSSETVELFGNYNCFAAELKFEFKYSLNCEKNVLKLLKNLRLVNAGLWLINYYSCV